MKWASPLDEQHLCTYCNITHLTSHVTHMNETTHDMNVSSRRAVCAYQQSRGQRCDFSHRISHISTVTWLIIIQVMSHPPKNVLIVLFSAEVRPTYSTNLELYQQVQVVMYCFHLRHAKSDFLRVLFLWIKTSTLGKRSFDFTVKYGKRYYSNMFCCAFST